MDNKKLKNYLNELAVINMACFIAWHIGRWAEKESLIYAVAACVSLSFICCCVFFIKVLKSKDTEEKIKNVKQIINQMIFDICFVAMCIVTA